MVEPNKPLTLWTKVDVENFALNLKFNDIARYLKANDITGDILDKDVTFLDDEDLIKADVQGFLKALQPYKSKKEEEKQDIKPPAPGPIQEPTVKRKKVFDQNAANAVTPANQPSALSEIREDDTESTQSTDSQMRVADPGRSGPVDDPTVRQKRQKKRIPHLKISSGMQSLDFPGRSSQPVTIGREGDLKLADKTVSRRHAMIYWNIEDNTFQIKDNKSTSGTFFAQGNNMEVRKGAIFELANIQFQVVDLILISKAQATIKLAVTEVCMPELTDFIGKEYQLQLVEKPCYIGSDSSSHIAIKDPRMLAKHAEIYLKGDKVMLTLVDRSQSIWSRLSLEGKESEYFRIQRDCNARLGDLQVHFQFYEEIVEK